MAIPSGIGLESPRSVLESALIRTLPVLLGAADWRAEWILTEGRV